MVESLSGMAKGLPAGEVEVLLGFCLWGKPFPPVDSSFLAARQLLLRYTHKGS